MVCDHIGFISLGGLKRPPLSMYFKNKNRKLLNLTLFAREVLEGTTLGDFFSKGKFNYLSNKIKYLLDTQTLKPLKFLSCDLLNDIWIFAGDFFC